MTLLSCKGNNAASVKRITPVLLCIVLCWHDVIMYSAQ